MKIKVCILLAVLTIAALCFGALYAPPEEVCAYEDYYGNVYSYSITEEPTQEYFGSRFTYKISKENIDHDFGHLKKTFSLPNGYNVDAQLEPVTIIGCIEQIKEEERAKGVSFDLSPLHGSNYYMHAEAWFSIKVGDVEKQVDYCYFTDEENYDYYKVVNVDPTNFQISYLTNFDSWANGITVSVTDSFDLEGTLGVRIVGYIDADIRTYTLLFDMGTMHMEPITDGSLIALKSYYEIESDFNGEQYASVNMEITPECKLFSVEDEDPCFILDDMDNDMPSSNCEISFIYNGALGISNDSYSLSTSNIGDEPYTVQGRLDFTTRDGKEYTLFTNVITIRRHNIELRIDGTTDYNVGVDKKHTYSVVFDNNDIDEAVTEIDWCYLISEPDAEVREGNWIYNVNEAEYTYTSPGIKTLEVYFQAIISGNETIGLYGIGFEINVLEAEPEHVFPKYEIDFGIPEDCAAILGGDAFEISPTINEVYGDEHFKLELTASGNAIGIISNENGKLTLIAVEAGRAVVYCTATSKSAGTFSKSMFVNVVESTEDNTSVIFRDDFVKTGSNIVAQLNVGGYTSFLNFSPQWTVQMEKDEGLVDVEFGVGAGNSVVANNVAKGYYLFSVSDDVIVGASAVKRAQNVNTAALAKQLLPYVAAVMLIGIIIAAVLTGYVKRRRTLGRRLDKVAETLKKLAEISPNSSMLRLNLKLVMRSLHKCLTEATSRDYKTLGQYQNVCQLLNNALNVCSAAIKSSDKLSNDKVSGIIESVRTRFVEKAARISDELDAAIFRAGKATQAAVTVAPAATEKDARKNAPNYLEMLTQFYQKGDDEDDNGREGDDDRNNDDETEN